MLAQAIVGDRRSKPCKKPVPRRCRAIEIWVAAGTYFPDEGPGIPNDDRSVAFVMKNGVEILGGFPAAGSPSLAQRNWTANPTILSGDIGTVGNDLDNSYHVILNTENNLNATAILDGFTITGGRADWVSGQNYRGGGMHNYASSPSIRNCVFTENYAYTGGGMYNYDASVTVNNCSFLDNTTVYSGAGIAFVLGASVVNR